ncbi:MAG TPA: hypothetical protein VMJ10_18900 [Kofleriaceae bacterium]|nr:hypothetical protein [Kofleriaceae bacterium]
MVAVVGAAHEPDAREIEQIAIDRRPDFFDRTQPLEDLGVAHRPLRFTEDLEHGDPLRRRSDPGVADRRS